ncbi:phosphate regulon sensor histidine kinase PhoR [Psychrobacter sp. I-STPA6b]|uniref:phosphate regulon sensor histidine kinase PhoR n=1 Tax=Psychrobacter sp. I-STPA6b TaxID=2585718 RepID=UPI001D0C51EE|nr:phosphate regulon sensor histidine kinase PhoR [Psychrobacter sp. I-STPA6b]
MMSDKHTSQNSSPDIAETSVKIERGLHSKSLFWADFKWLLFWLCMGTVLGAYLSVTHKSSFAWGLVAGLLIYYVWRLFAMQQFYNWLSRSLTLPPPEFSGGLSFVASELYHSKKQEQITHQKMMGLIKKIRSSLLALQDAVILLDKDDCLEWWNQSAEKLLQLRSENQGSNILDLIKADEFYEYYTTAESPNDGLRIQSWQDPERFLQCEVTHFGQEKLLIIYDVTRLQHLEQMRKDFVANVSHELRTPLTVIMGYIETFSDQPDLDPKWQRGFSLMSQQTRRMNSIINDLLLLSRLENEEIAPTECVDMPKVLAHLFDDAQAYNKEYGHLIDLHIDSQKNLYGSEMYLNSALLNLVTNAIKYTPKGGEISISWQEVKDGCLFAVSDNGIGIAPAHIERLTERFYRVDSGRSRATGGTGLGLAIVKHVLYQHDATLKIESTEGQGSTFKVFFPLEQVCCEGSCHASKDGTCPKKT